MIAQAERTVEESGSARFSRNLTGATLAGAALALSFPPYGIPILLPAGIGLLIASIEGLSPRLAFYAGFACGLVYFGATMFWLANLFGLASLSLIAIGALFPALFCG